MDPIVIHHLDAGARNLTIALDLLHHTPRDLDQPAFEWVVTIGFYSAVRNVNAYLHSLGQPVPESHVARTRAIQSNEVLTGVRQEYEELENWSRAARYTRPHSYFDGYRAQIAVDNATAIQEHIRRALGVT